MTRLLYLFISLLLVSCSENNEESYTPGDPDSPTDKPTIEKNYNKLAKNLFEDINNCYLITSGSTKGLYNENYPKKTGDNSASYLWPLDGLISGVANLHRLGYEVGYTDLVNKYDVYYRDSYNNVSVGGYCSGTNGVKGDGTRFYDDNSIVGINLVDAFSLTGNKKYLNEAKQIVAFLKSGEDDILGGGLWWNEGEKNISNDVNSNKPACANGFATWFLLKYYSVCEAAEKADVLSFATRLYKWVDSNLRDPDDNCYWNDRQNDGTVNKTKWTYNTGAMISNGILLYRITNDNYYLDNAKASAEGSYSFFVRPVGNVALSYPDHDPWFTVKLIKAYIELEPLFKPAGNYIKTFINCLDTACDKARFSNGLFYEDWTGSSAKRAEQLLMQDAALEALGMIAIYKDEKNSK
ncbi:MAG: glycoside hydrolase family 76 protein [Bacteroidales bacterium]